MGPVSILKVEVAMKILGREHARTSRYKPAATKRNFEPVPKNTVHMRFIPFFRRTRTLCLICCMRFSSSHWKSFFPFRNTSKITIFNLGDLSRVVSYSKISKSPGGAKKDRLIQHIREDRSVCTNVLTFGHVQYKNRKVTFWAVRAR